MTEIVQKFAELDILRKELTSKISKVHHIMFAQDISLLTPEIESYRVNYLNQLHRHRKVIEDQQDELLEKIDIKEIIPVILE